MNFANSGLGLQGRSTSFLSTTSLSYLLPPSLSLSVALALCSSLTLTLSIFHLTLSLSLSLSLPHSFSLSLSDSLTPAVCLSLSLSPSLFLFSLVKRACYQNHARRWFRESFANVFVSREVGHFGNKEFRTTPICINIHIPIIHVYIHVQLQYICIYIYTV